MGIPHVRFTNFTHTEFTVGDLVPTTRQHRYCCYSASQMHKWDSFVTKMLGWLWNGFKTARVAIHADEHDLNVFMRENEIKRLHTESMRIQETWKRFQKQAQRKSEQTVVPSAHLSRPIQIHNPLCTRIRSFNNDSCNDSVIGVYITTNEVGLETTNSVLRSHPRKPLSCHIGFSGWYNFDLMALRKSSYGIICDFNPQNRRFIEKTVQLLRESPSRQLFIAKLTKFLQGDRSIEFSPNVTRSPINPVDEINEELTRNGSWLCNDESFLYIRSLAMLDTIAAITVDIRDSTPFRKMTRLFQDNGIAIDSLYLSNISFYMFSGEDRTAYLNTVHSLIEDDTLIIHCPELIDIPSDSPAQQVDLGKRFLSATQDERFFRLSRKDMVGELL